MKIQVLSDLHLDHLRSETRLVNKTYKSNVTLRNGCPELYMLDQTAADVIVLAGDIASGTSGIEWAGRESTTLGKPFVYIAGNHEFYGHEYCSELAKMRKVAEEYGVHFLERDVLVINNTRFLGCTLWVDFEATGDKEQSVDRVRRGVADFTAIRVPDEMGCRATGKSTENDTVYRYMEPEDQVALFEDSVTWLRTKLAEPFDGTTVVVTHHGVSSSCQHPGFPLDMISAAFWSNLEELVEQADLWIFGHTHACLDIEVRGTRLVSNQGGYPREYVSGFEPNKLVDV